MPRLKDTEREVKKLCLLEAFEVLKKQSYMTSKNCVSKIKVLELANSDKRMEEFNKKIGDKSIYSKAKNSIYPSIMSSIDRWIKDYKKQSNMATKTTKDKLKNMNLKLEQNEAYLIELQEEILRLNEIIDNKEHIILQVEEDRDSYAKQLSKLRKKHVNK
jgi:uncharacterized membrane protein